MIATRTADGDSPGVSGCDARVVERDVVQRAIINSAVRRGPTRVVDFVTVRADVTPGGESSSRVGHASALLRSWRHACVVVLALCPGQGGNRCTRRR
jgi:hypothetical protein